jgi:hypothetical protein
LVGTVQGRLKEKLQQAVGPSYSAVLDSMQRQVGMAEAQLGAGARARAQAVITAAAASSGSTVTNRERAHMTARLVLAKKKKPMSDAMQAAVAGTLGVALPAPAISSESLADYERQSRSQAAVPGVGGQPGGKGLQAMTDMKKRL